MGLSFKSKYCLGSSLSMRDPEPAAGIKVKNLVIMILVGELIDEAS